jgi:hypothetical protein
MPDAEPDKRGLFQVWEQRRRERIRAEIERNRQGGHKVPTWVLVLILVVFVAGWAALVFLS